MCPSYLTKSQHQVLPPIFRSILHYIPHFDWINHMHSPSSAARPVSSEKNFFFTCSKAYSSVKSKVIFSRKRNSTSPSWELFPCQISSFYLQPNKLSESTNILCKSGKLCFISVHIRKWLKPCSDWQVRFPGKYAVGVFLTENKKFKWKLLCKFNV